MINYVNWRNSFCWIECEHSLKEVHEERVVIKAVTLILLQSLVNVFQNLILFRKDSFTLSTLYTEYSLAHH